MVSDKLYASDGTKVRPPRYVIKTCREFCDIWDGKNKKYIISDKKKKQVEGIVKLLNMPKGLRAGQPMDECLCEYQWLFLCAVLCTVYRTDEEKRRYENAILEICRKNFKTYTVAIVFIILMITEPKFSQFYSVAPDGSLSREVRNAIDQTVKSSPSIYEYNEIPRFNVLRDTIDFVPKESRYTPLNYTNSRFDGKLPAAFLADEVGALPNNYAIDAMRSGQLNVLNKLGCIISTKYPTLHNPFEDEVDYCKRVLDGVVDDETTFSLLYEPDETKEWATDDLILRQPNPVALEIPEIWADLVKKRTKAINSPITRENFLTKHCNIIYSGGGTESYVRSDALIKCRTEQPIDWRGKYVYLGVDLSQTDDNTAVAMVCIEDGILYSKVMCFIPEERIDEKSKNEHLQYKNFMAAGECIACGEQTIDYGTVEDYVFDIEQKYGVHVMGIGYDRYNCMSSAQKWEKSYTTVEIRQHSSVLHPATKYLYEAIMNKKFQYDKNKLYEINFENAVCAYDTNLNRYVHKKKSRGKVDMVVATINAVYLALDNSLASDFVVQC